MERCEGYIKILNEIPRTLAIIDKHAQRIEKMNVLKGPWVKSNVRKKFALCTVEIKTITRALDVLEPSPEQLDFSENNEHILNQQERMNEMEGKMKKNQDNDVDKDINLANHD